jgi:HSP20 family protein
MFTAFRNGSMVPASSNRLSTLLDHFFTETPFERAAAPTLPMAIWDDEQKIVVELDAPGIPEGAFDIALHDNVLTVKADRKPRDGASYDSRSYGSWEQSVRLPKTVDANAVTANLANGVLTITVGKRPEAQPKKIAVTAQLGQ